MNDFEYDIEMVQLADNETDYNKKLTPEDIELRKKASRIFSEAESKAKLSYCVLCGKECSSFCNSHSVPQFALYRVAENGMVSETLQNKALLHEKSLGVKQTGTFKLICDTCDNESFQDYENPSSYSKEPTNKMIAQIALKNYLQMVYKRLVERELFTLLGQKFPHNKDISDEKVFIETLDLSGYISSLKYAQKAIKKANDKYYYLYYYKVLDYVVPYTAQSAITLISDFDDEVINNLYNLSPEYKTKDIHVAVFPLETTSVVMLFIEEGEKRYRNFYKQFKKLSPEDQLSAINYIIFSNIENVFINPKVQKDIRENKRFVEICGMTTEVTAEVESNFEPLFDCSDETLLAKAIKEFSLSRRHEIPNLLSREYAMPSDNKEV